MRKNAFLSALAALVAGLCLWYAALLVQRFAGQAIGRTFGSGLSALLVNVAIEELMRLALIGAAAAAIKQGREPSTTRRGARLCAFALLSGVAFGSMENLSYLLAFPSLDIFWRLGYSLPIHINASLLYALAFYPLEPGRGSRRSVALSRALKGATALSLCIAWHGGFNAAASLGFFNALPALGSALNAAGFIALALVSERKQLLTGAFDGRTGA